MRKELEYELPYFDEETKEVKIENILISFVSMRNLTDIDKIRDSIIETKNMWDNVSDLITKAAICKENKKSGYKKESENIANEIELLNKKIIDTQKHIPNMRIDLIINILERNKKPGSGITDEMLTKYFWETNIDYNIHNDFIFEVSKKDITGKKKVIEK